MGKDEAYEHVCLSLQAGCSGSSVCVFTCQAVLAEWNTAAI